MAKAHPTYTEVEKLTYLLRSFERAYAGRFGDKYIHIPSCGPAINIDTHRQLLKDRIKEAEARVSAERLANGIANPSDMRDLFLIMDNM